MNRRAADAFRAAHQRCKVNQGTPHGQRDLATSARELDRKIDRPKRPCVVCGKKFQPTIQRRVMCRYCFTVSTSGEVE